MLAVASDGWSANRMYVTGTLTPTVLRSVSASDAASSSLPKLEKTPAAKAMAGALAHASTGRLPARVVAAVARLARSAHAGRLRAGKGRVLLSKLGPKHRSVYVFPTTKGAVCFDITHLAEGCKRAFLVGEPASIDGGSFFYPPTSGPPAEMAGLTKDGVKRVRVVVRGTPHKAVFGHDAWYYRFPDNRIPATAATKLIVTLEDGSTKVVPTRIIKP